MSETDRVIRCSPGRKGASDLSAANEQNFAGYWIKTADRLARRVDELEAALETLAHWPLEKSRFEAEKFAKEALRRAVP